MKYNVSFENNGFTYPLLNNVSFNAKSVVGFKRAFKNVIEKKMFNLAIWYGHGVKLTATATNSETGIIAGSCNFIVL